MNDVQYDGRYDFKKWDKIPRLSNEEMIVTEKVDGSNGCIVILPYDEAFDEFPERSNFVRVEVVGDDHMVAVQSRTRFLFPGKQTDNFGFAGWVHGVTGTRKNLEELVFTLGYGRHYGEWWGSGIQRGYGMQNGERGFTLFDTRRWGRDTDNYDSIMGCGADGLDVVPELYRGPVNLGKINEILVDLDTNGSKVVSSYQKAEGVIVNFSLSRVSYKAFINDDGVPKSMKISK